MTTTKTEINVRIGRTYYQALTDAQGYPNGMQYWPEIKPESKYHITCEALGFIELLVHRGLITLNQPIGVSDGDKFNEGECKELMDHFKTTDADELKDHEERLAKFQAVWPKTSAG